jgi:hypothetical protein
MERGGESVGQRRTYIVASVASVLCAAWLGCREAPGSTEFDHDISADDMRARVSFLASDQLLGRATPSRGLDIAADYVRSEFVKFGLEAPRGGYLQRYQLAMSDRGSGWSLAVRRGNRRATLSYGEEFWGVPWTAGTVEGRARYVGVTPPEAAVEDDETVWIAHLDRGVMPREWLAAASRSGAVGLVFVVDEDLGPYVSDWQDAEGSIYDLGDVQANVPAVLVSSEALDAASQRLDMGPTFVTRGVMHSGVRIELSADLSVQTLRAPNVVGVVPGSDPELADEYVLVSAHMDGLGLGRAIDGDSIYNGADDNASGTSAMMEVAEAMAALEEGPRRSVMFLAVSGEEIGLLGSTWFVAHAPVPLDKVVADLNIDMVGRNWQDTIAVVGNQYSTLGATIDSVAAAHPELNMTPVGDQWPAEGFFFRSDHYNFARKGIPAVFFFNGTHADYHRPSDEADRIEFGKAARISRLIFEVALAVANADEQPRWDPAARARIVEPGL